MWPTELVICVCLILGVAMLVGYVRLYAGGFCGPGRPLLQRQ